MAVIDSLSIALKADTASFISGMKKASKAFKSWMSGMTRLVTAVGGLAAVMTGISGLGFSQVFKETLKDADRVGKLSDEIGIAVDELFGLEFAATIAGTSMEVLTRGLQRMNRRIGEAAMGYGEGAKAMDQLGLNVDDLIGLSADEQFLRIADSVNSLGSQANKAASVYALFGRQGQFLLNTFQMQRGGIKVLIKESKELLGTYNRDEFRIFEELNDSVVRLKASMKGFALGLGAELATKMAAGILTLKDALVSLRKKELPMLTGAFKNLLDSTLRFFNRNAEAVVTLGALTVEVFDLVLSASKTFWSGFIFSASTTASAIGILNKELTNLYGRMDNRSGVRVIIDSLRGAVALVKAFILVNVSFIRSTFLAMADVVVMMKNELKNLARSIYLVVGGFYLAIVETIEKIGYRFERLFTFIGKIASAPLKQIPRMFQDLRKHQEDTEKAITKIQEKYAKKRAKLRLSAGAFRTRSESMGLFSMEEAMKEQADIINEMLDLFNETGASGDKNIAKYTEELKEFLTKIENFELKMPEGLKNPENFGRELQNSLDRLTAAMTKGSQSALAIIARAQNSALKKREDEAIQEKRADEVRRKDRVSGVMNFFGLRQTPTFPNASQPQPPNVFQAHREKEEAKRQTDLLRQLNNNVVGDAAVYRMI